MPGIPTILIVGVSVMLGCWALMLWRMWGHIDDQGEPIMPLEGME